MYVSRIPEILDMFKKGKEPEEIAMALPLNPDEIMLIIAAYTPIKRLNIAKSSKLSYAQKEPKGALSQLIMRLVNELLALRGTLSVSVLIGAVIKQLPLAAGKRDTRRQVVIKAIDSLITKEIIGVVGSNIYLK